MEKDDEGNSKLHLALLADDIRKACRLIRSGADVSAKSLSGETPLTIAVERGQFSAVKLLLRYGASTHVVDEHGMSPLHLAAAISNVYSGRITTELLRAGAQINRRDHEDLWTPLHWATFNANWAVATRLIRAGAKLSLRDRDGRKCCDFVMAHEFYIEIRMNLILTRHEKSVPTLPEMLERIRRRWILLVCEKKFQKPQRAIALN